MGIVRTAGARLMGAVMALLVAITAVFAATALPSTAYAADEAAVRDAANGVLKFNWSIDGDEYSRGSCFLINENYVLTAYHCTMFSSRELDLYGYSGTNLQDLRDRMTYSVSINRDVKVGATLVNYSEEQDFAILKLDQELNGYQALPYRDASTVKATETVYSIGFPGNNDMTVISTYTPEDATIRRGTVTKAENIYQGMAGGGFAINGYFIQTDCAISGGDSGGPMLDADGNVVGISVMGDDANGYYFAVASDKVKEVLDTLKIEWGSDASGNVSSKSAEPSSGSSSSNKLDFSNLTAAISAANAKNDSSKYTQESFAALTEALNAANEARDLNLDDPTDKAEYSEKQKQIDDAAKALNDAVAGLQEPAPGPDMTLIVIAIIAAIVIIVAIVVIVVVMRGRKSRQDANAPDAGAELYPTGAAPASQSQLPAGSAAKGAVQDTSTSVLGVDSSSTTVLSDQKDDTILLFQAAEGGSITRMGTNDVIPINSANFSIGSDRRNVDYHLDIDGVSRQHAHFVVRNGKTYLIDDGSTNGTEVNNVKCRKGQEVELKDGDVISIAGVEKFKYSR